MSIRETPCKANKDWRITYAIKNNKCLLRIMKKILFKLVILLAFAATVISCRDTGDKAKDVSEETVEALEETGQDLKEIGEDALGKKLKKQEIILKKLSKPLSILQTE